MSVRPVLLGLYEKYFLPLQKLLLPSLQAFVVGLLPGLEEGSEIYDRWVSARAQGRPPRGRGVPACVLFRCFVRNWGETCGEDLGSRVGAEVRLAFTFLWCLCLTKYRVPL